MATDAKQVKHQQDKDQANFGGEQRVVEYTREKSLLLVN